MAASTHGETLSPNHVTRKALLCHTPVAIAVDHNVLRQSALADTHYTNCPSSVRKLPASYPCINIHILACTLAGILSSSQQSLLYLFVFFFKSKPYEAIFFSPANANLCTVSTSKLNKQQKPGITMIYGHAHCRKAACIFAGRHSLEGYDGHQMPAPHFKIKIGSVHEDVFTFCEDEQFVLCPAVHR